MQTCRTDRPASAPAPDPVVRALRARSEHLLLAADHLEELAACPRWHGRGLERVVDHLWQRGVQVAADADRLAATPPLVQ